MADKYNDWGRTAAKAVLHRLEQEFGKGYASVLTVPVIHALYDQRLLYMVMSWWDRDGATLAEADKHIRAARRHLGMIND